MEQFIASEQKPSKKKLFLILIIILILAIACIAAYFFFASRGKNSDISSISPIGDGKKEEVLESPPVWVEGAMTQPLPANASKTRLTIPYSNDELMINGAPIVGFGVHTGQHIEGLDHVWISIVKDGTSKAWSDGKITGIEELGYQGEEYMVKIDYGNGLECINGELKKALVSKGQTVKTGDPIGIVRDMGQFEGVGEIEIYCSDSNLKYGTITSNGNNKAVAVSPFDYLTDAEQTRVVNLYEEKVIKPFLSSGKALENWQPTEPFLTNKIMIHKPNKIVGEWFLANKKYNGEDLTLLTFAESENKYYTGNAFHLRAETYENFEVKKYIDGNYSVAYEGNRGKLTLAIKDQFSGKTSNSYALFEITEDAAVDITGAKRAQMKFEYSEKPINEFSDNALVYQSRGIKNPRREAGELGLMKSE